MFEMDIIDEKLLLPQDKANHVAYGLIIYTVICIYNTLLALVIVCIVALGKEVWDSYGNGTKDWKDFLYTITVPVVVEAVRSIM